VWARPVDGECVCGPGPWLGIEWENTPNKVRKRETTSTKDTFGDVVDNHSRTLWAVWIPQEVVGTGNGSVAWFLTRMDAWPRAH